MMSSEAQRAAGADAQVAITGIGVVSPAGVGLPALWELLCQGRSAARPYGTEASGAAATGAPAPEELGLAQRVPSRRLRRMGRSSRLAVVAAGDALAQAGAPAGERTGLVLGTGLGPLQETARFVAQLQQEGPAGASPSLFPNLVMSVAASYTAMELDLQGYSATVNFKVLAGELALMTAVDALRLGRAPAIVAGGVEELSPAVHAAYQRRGTLAEAGPARPYARPATGMLLGESACMFHLELLSVARARGARVLARVQAVAAAGRRDGAPPFDHALRAVRRCLTEADLSPEQVDLVVGSGCGDARVDDVELDLLRALFGDRAIPLSSPHGAIGSGMAAGALRMGAAVGALAAGRVFPTLTDGTASVRAPGLLTRATQIELRNTLVLGQADGGGAAAVLLAPGDP